MSQNKKNRIRNWIIGLSICIGISAVLYRWVLSDVAVRGIIQIVWRKWTQKILPNQPVHWLMNYQSKTEIWRNFHISPDFEERPNILLIVADDLGINDLGGGCGIWTPNIESIGRNGINFTNAYAAHATCAPSRAALFTGRYPTSIGMEFTPIPKFFARFMADKRPVHAAQTIYHQELYDLVPDMINIHLPKTSPIISEVLKEVGYHNYFLGKWDGSFNPDEFSPLHRGYDETLAIPLGASLYASTKDPRIVSSNNISVDQFMKKFLSYYIHFNNGPAFEPSDYLTDYLGTEAVTLIHRLAEKRSNHSQVNQNKQQQFAPDEPWFTTITFTAPHNPFQALKSDYESPDIQAIPSFIGRVYASMIKSLDRNVGKILQALRETQQYENTLILFTSDNGGAPYVGLSHLNAPYRGWKATLFEGGLRVPLLVQWPKKIEAGLVSTSPVIHLDIFPSLVKIATQGLQKKVIEGVKTDWNALVLNGKDFLSGLFKTATTATSYEEVEDSQSTVAISEQNLELHKEKEQEKRAIPLQHTDHSRIFFWRSGRYKTLRYYQYKLQVHSYLDKLWLFDLLKDPTERDNLIPVIAFAKGISSLSESKLKELMTMRMDIPDVQEEELFSILFFLYQRLQEINLQQSEPLWPALVELPICIDKPQLEGDLCTLEEEHIIWAN